MMKITKPTKHAARFLLLSLGAMLLTGCFGRNWFTYTGREAKPENRFVLKEGGPHAAVWHSSDLDLHYQYRLEGDRLEIEGRVVRQNRIKHFDHLTAWVSIHMLDTEGVILDTHRLWSQRGSDVYGGLRWTFRHSWRLPPGNRAVGFSFSGVAGDRDTQWEFWQLP